MSFIWRIFLMFVKHQAKLRVLAEAKKVGTLAYLRAVQGTRQALVIMLLTFFALQFMVLAGFGALVTGVMLWEADPTFKLQVLFGLFIALSGLPALFLAFVFSERFWFKFSGAQKMVDSLNDRDAA